jgi:hypothetical protein
LTAEEITELFSDVPTNVAMPTVNPESRLFVYPNPVNDVLNFKYESQSDNSNAILKLYDIYGKLIWQEYLQRKQLGEIIVNSIPSGIYLLKVTDRNISSTAKIVIKH